MLTQTKVTSKDILTALAKLHRDIYGEFFMAELKTGATQTGVRIFDAVTIKKSWVHPCITGFEIKISRQDFLRDTKYSEYLPYCHKFYFVVPEGLIERQELSDSIGLIYYNPKTKILSTKKNAVYRDITVSSDFLMSIIMNKLDNDRLPFHKDSVDYWNDWYENKVANNTLGNRVSYKLNKTLEKLNSELRDRDRKIKLLAGFETERYEIFRILQEYTGNYVSNIPETLKKILSQKVPSVLDFISQDLNSLNERVKRMIGEFKDE